MRQDFPYRLYLVISEEACMGRPLLEVAEQAIQGGVDLVQLREKTDRQSVLLEKARAMKALTQFYKVPLLINDDWQVARDVHAAGVHVGNNDAAPSLIRNYWREGGKLIGYSIEHLDQLDNAESVVADYLAISPVFTTPTKTDTVTQWGIEGIRQIRNLTGMPLVAIGNIHAANAREVMQAGADAVAVVSAICAASDPKKAAEQIKNEIFL